MSKENHTQHIEIKKEQVRDVKKGARMAKYVLRKLNNGVTDMPAKSGTLDLRNAPPLLSRLDEGAYSVAKNILGQAGVTIDTYGRYEGSTPHDWTDRVTVTEVNGEPIQPSPGYQHELKMRDYNQAREEQPVR